MNHIKFKMLASGYPLFRFPENLLEEVDLHDFYKAEEDRYPLYIETQFGIFPRDFPVQSFESKKIAILENSNLSGVQSSITIYEIREGKRVEIQKILMEKPFWDGEKLKKYNDEPVESPKIKIPGFYIYEIWFYLEKIGIKYRGHSLPETYHQALSKAYKDFVIFSSQNGNSDWINFLGTKQAEAYLNLFNLLDQCSKTLYPDSQDFPLPLEKELRMFRNIRNPYRVRSNKFSELPAEEDILILSDVGLCIYYNNFININSYEAEMIQKDILQELRHRDFYVKNENLLMNHANPIEIRMSSGTPVLTINDEVMYRREKDIALWENGPSNPQMIYEHYYGLYNKITDVQLVNNLNEEIEIRYWGMGRAAYIRAIKAQLKSRGINTSSISDDQSFSLKYCVVLENKNLVRLGELPQHQLRPILKSYLRKCYPKHKLGEIKIINYNLETVQIENSTDKAFYQFPINDLLKKKGEMKTIERPGQL